MTKSSAPAIRKKTARGQLLTLASPKPSSSIATSAIAITIIANPVAVRNEAAIHDTKNSKTKTVKQKIRKPPIATAAEANSPPLPAARAIAAKIADNVVSANIILNEIRGSSLLRRTGWADGVFTSARVLRNQTFQIARMSQRTIFPPAILLI